MKCPSCGKENNEGAKFCKHCGASLNVNVSQPINSQPKDNPKDNKNTLIICATAIICVIIIAGAFVFLNSGNNEDVNVNTVESMSNDSVSEDASNDKNTEDSMTYAEATNYLSGASSTVIQNTFDEADANGDGLLTGSEISKFKKLADLTERTADTSNTENVEAQDYGAGDGTTKTRYCTTHGRVAVGSDNRCPYCEAEGLDSRTVKGSTEYI
jgi:hypothetical protein